MDLEAIPVIPRNPPFQLLESHTSYFSDGVLYEIYSPFAVDLFGPYSLNGTALKHG